ncbi:MAG: ATP-binding protein [Anaerolineales bacterium]|jgi:signal transduction histidine kinase
MTCPNCGVDLGLVALLAERAYLEGFPGAAPIPVTPEALVPRIGEFLIEQNLLTSEQLDLALKQQRKSGDETKRRLLGEILVEMNLIDREVLDTVINRQIIALHSALQEANRNLEKRVAQRTMELEQALANLTELNQIKANFISNVSHELRTPLAHIKGYVELLLGSQLGPMEAGQMKALQVVQRSTTRLEHLIDDLIEFSTSSREGIGLRTQAFQINDLLENVCQRSSDKAQNAEITLTTDTADDLPMVRGDMERLSWVLIQLVDNGIKFTPSGGHVTLKSTRNENQAIISVIDTGIGIPTDRIDEIFVPFHQLDGASDRRYGGTGLGLAMVKLILNAHDSEIHIDSEKNKGSTFSFALPLA